LKKKKKYNSYQPTKEVVRDLVDQDYWHKLTKAEKDWLNQFNSEYYYDNIKQDSKLCPNSVELYIVTGQRRRNFNIAHGRPIPAKNAFGTLSPEDALITAYDFKKMGIKPATQGDLPNKLKKYKSEKS